MVMRCSLAGKNASYNMAFFLLIMAYLFIGALLVIGCTTDNGSEENGHLTQSSNGPNGPDSPGGGASGVKTLTVKGGLGKPSGSADVFAGTRDITVTVTLADGVIADVKIGHQIEASSSSENPFGLDADMLAGAIAVANNANAAFTPSGNYAGRAREAWNNHERAIRNAVKDAIVAIEGGKPNRALTRTDGEDPRWQAGGENLSGVAVITGSGYMGGSLRADFSVTVKVDDGRIISVTGEGDDAKCAYGNRALAVWPDRVIGANDYRTLDAVSGATVTTQAMRALIQRGIEKIANEY